MRKKLLTILAILVMLTITIPAVASQLTIPTQLETSETNDSVNIILQQNEELVWVNPEQNLKSNDIAYVVEIKEEIDDPITSPAYRTFFRSVFVIAKNSRGIPQFWEKTQGRFYFSTDDYWWNWKCYKIDSTGSRFGVFPLAKWYKYKLFTWKTVDQRYGQLECDGRFSRTPSPPAWGCAGTSITVHPFGWTDYSRWFWFD